MGDLFKFMFLISISHLNIDLGCRLVTTIAGASPLFEQGGEEARAVKHHSVERPSRERENLPGGGETLLLGTSHSGAPVSGLYDQSAGGVGDALNTLQRPVRDVFPANKIFTKCGCCGKGIERFKGYKHYWVGDRKTYCWNCHQAMGLPLREVL